MHQADDDSKKKFHRPLLSQDIFRWFQKEWDDPTKRNVKHRLGVKDGDRNATITITFEYLPDKRTESEKARDREETEFEDAPDGDK